MTEPHPLSVPSILVVIPVYRHLATIRTVAQGCLAHHPSVLIIDDGNTEPACDRVAGLDVRIVRHETNRGKGWAIQTAAAYARERGFSHIVTIDADGQHDPDCLPEFLGAMRAEPGAVVLGVRDFNSPTIPGGSKFGRAFGNFWVRLQTGVPIRDIQSGYRAYPVFVLESLPCLFHTYAYEDEVVVRALWAGVPVRQIPIPVYYPPKAQRISSFRLIRENVRLTILNTWLTVRSILPWPHRQIQYEQGRFSLVSRPVRIVRDLLAKEQTPAKLGWAAALGVILGALPLIACHTLAIMLAASHLGLSRIMAIAASHSCMPPLVPAVCIELGYYFRFGRFLTWSDAAGLSEASLPDWGRMGLDRLLDWFIGSLAVGPVLGLIIGMWVFIVARQAQKAIQCQTKRQP